MSQRLVSTLPNGNLSGESLDLLLTDSERAFRAFGGPERITFARVGKSWKFAYRRISATRDSHLVYR
jgi:hypothetical protein